MSSPTEMLRQEIALKGPIPFARFMELALYCPESGYYERAEVGRAGDFYTSPSSGSLFGQLLACQFAQWLAPLPTPRVQIAEAGAHQGALAADILAWLRQHRPQLLERLDYWIIEPSELRQHRQRNALEDFAGHLRWFPDWKSTPSPGVSGVIFSNELLDAFPVRRLGWDAARRSWFEWAVLTQGDGFSWARVPISAKKVVAAFAGTGLSWTDALLAVLPNDFTLEVAPEARRWWHQAASALRAGKLLTLDYGLTAEECLRPERPSGTVRAYRRHAVSADVLARPGEQDLTAHVNWTQLQLAGEAAGLRTLGLWRQESFLTNIARQLWEEPGETPWTQEQVRAFQTLTHPEHLGRAFRVLVQTR